jgi:hypothetical protein
MKSSIQWFEDAVNYGTQDSDYFTMATIYRDIGKFNRDITLNIEEASDRGMYLPYFENIRDLLVLVESGSDENEIVRLELYRLAVNSIETYAHKFRVDGLAREDVQGVFDMARDGTMAVPALTEKTENMKADITNRLEPTQAAIDNAYSNEGGENT